MIHAVIILIFTGIVVWSFAPVLTTFFGPQSFITFLNPLKAETPYFQYLRDGWSWQNDQGTLVGFFRPLASTLYMLEYPLFGIQPMGYKLVSFFLHLLSSLLIGLTVFSISGRRVAGLAAGMLFAVHPGSLWAVGLISTRPDILAAVFSILAFRSTFSLSRFKGFDLKKALLPALFTLLALLAKELGVANLFALPVLFFLWPGKETNRKNGLILILSLAVVALIYFTGRFLIFGGVGGYDSTASLNAVLRWIPVIVLQVSGAAYLSGAAKVALLSVEILLLGVFLYRKRSQGVRMLAAGILITGIYSFQSILSYPEPHYVYAPAMFSTLFIVCLASFAGLTEGRMRLPSAVLLITILAGSVVTLRKDGALFNLIAAPPQRIYAGLSALTDELMETAPEECLILLTGSDIPEQREMKNAPIYLAYLYSGSCRFSLTFEPVPSGIPVIMWDGTEAVLLR